MKNLILAMAMLVVCACAAKQPQLSQPEAVISTVDAEPRHDEVTTQTASAPPEIVYITGNTSEDALHITPEETNQIIENIKLTPDSNEFWASLDQQAGHTYYFASTSDTRFADIKAVVLGPPNQKVHMTADDNGGDGNNFVITYPETKSNPHVLKVWLASGEEWTGNLVYSAKKTK